MDVRTLIRDEGEFTQSYVAVPRKGGIYVPNDKVPLIAVVLSYGMWTREKIHNTHWRFFKYGIECKWDELDDEQRMEVRTRVAWDGQVRDYWTELEYRDERYCILEALT